MPKKSLSIRSKRKSVSDLSNSLQSIKMNRGKRFKNKKKETSSIVDTYIWGILLSTLAVFAHYSNVLSYGFTNIICIILLIICVNSRMRQLHPKNRQVLFLSFLFILILARAVHEENNPNSKASLITLILGNILIFFMTGAFGRNVKPRIDLSWADGSLIFFSIDGSHVGLMNNMVKKKIFRVVRENEYDISYNYVQQEDAAVPQFVHIPIGELAAITKVRVNIPNKGRFNFINMPVIWNSETYPAQLDNLKDTISNIYNSALIMTLNVRNVDNFLTKASLLNVNNILDSLEEESFGYTLILTGFTSNSCTDPAIIKKIQSCSDLNIKPYTVLCLSSDSLSNEMIQHIINSSLDDIDP